MLCYCSLLHYYVCLLLVLFCETCCSALCVRLYCFVSIGGVAFVYAASLCITLRYCVSVIVCVHWLCCSIYSLCVRLYCIVSVGIIAFKTLLYALSLLCASVLCVLCGGIIV
jgi:hypothetical protein